MEERSVSSIIKGPKDFWTGIIYLIFGCTALLIGRDYGMGSAMRMGPGYFPVVLAGLLVLFGLIALVRAFIRPGEAIGGFALKPTVLVLGGTLLFGFLMQRAGLIVAILALVLLAASASEKFRFEWKATAGLIALVAFCALVFVKGLGVPMPLVGTWFGN